MAAEIASSVAGRRLSSLRTGMAIAKSQPHFSEPEHPVNSALPINGGDCSEFGDRVALAQRFGEGRCGAKAADAVMAHPLILGDNHDVAHVIVGDVGIESVLAGFFHKAFHTLAVLFLVDPAIIEQLLDRLGVLGNTLGTLL